ncbi:hypothetical protein [Aliiroseovarius marinus]|uniref:hypothetical protein n=1 Tax=Aliiroseovarius marinus TaxID=2500159 RepID=UPI003D7E1A52
MVPFLFVLGVNFNIPIGVQPVLGGDFYFGIWLRASAALAELCFYFGFGYFILGTITEHATNNLPKGSKWKMVSKLLAALTLGVLLSYLKLSGLNGEQISRLLTCVYLSSLGAGMSLLFSGVEWLQAEEAGDDSKWIKFKVVWPIRILSWNQFFLGMSFAVSWIVFAIGFGAPILMAGENVKVVLPSSEFVEVKILMRTADGFVLRGRTDCEDCIWFASVDGSVVVQSLSSD